MAGRPRERLAVSTGCMDSGRGWPESAGVGETDGVAGSLSKCRPERTDAARGLDPKAFYSKAQRRGKSPAKQ